MAFTPYKPKKISPFAALGLGAASFGMTMADLWRRADDKKRAEFPDWWKSMIGAKSDKTKAEADKSLKYAPSEPSGQSPQELQAQLDGQGVTPVEPAPLDDEELKKRLTGGDTYTADDWNNAPDAVQTYPVETPEVSSFSMGG